MTREQQRSGGNVSAATGAGMRHSAAVPELIYCANGNGRTAEIAINAGFTYGAQLPGTVYFPPEFVDQDWKNPDKTAYMTELFKYKPRMATVLDWEYDEQLHEVLGWAEDAAAFADTVIIIPKVWGGIARLPRRIGGASVRLGYSVPTRHGGTNVTLFEFVGWPVHLLGGSPGQQIKLYHHGLNVESVDGNMMNLMANRHCAFWQPGKRPFTNSWPSLKQANGGELWGDGSATADAPYEAFRRSCKNIMAAWQEVTK